LVLLPAILGRRAAVRREWQTNFPRDLAAAVLSPGAYLLVIFAFQLSKAAYVVAGRAMSIVLSALIGSLWMREGHLVQRLPAAAVVAAGGVCVALARWGGPPLAPGRGGQEGAKPPPPPAPHPAGGPQHR